LLEASIWIFYQGRQLVDDFYKQNGCSFVVILVKSYQVISLTMKYCGNSTTEGAQLPFLRSKEIMETDLGSGSVKLTLITLFGEFLLLMHHLLTSPIKSLGDLVH
jgi:hypothetical protein